MVILEQKNQVNYMLGYCNVSLNVFVLSSFILFLTNEEVD